MVIYLNIENKLLRNFPKYPNLVFWQLSIIEVFMSFCFYSSYYYYTLHCFLNQKHGNQKLLFESKAVHYYFCVSRLCIHPFNSSISIITHPSTSHSKKKKIITTLFRSSPFSTRKFSILKNTPLYQHFCSKTTSRTLFLHFFFVFFN